MSDNGKDTQPSQMRVTFNSPGSAQFTTDLDNVGPAQMYAFASWLQWYAGKMFDADLAQKAQAQAARQIQIPAGIDLKKGPPNA